MNAFYEAVAPWLGLGVDPKDLTFFQISLRGVVILLATLAIVRLGNKRSLSHKSAYDSILLVILASILSRAINGSAAFFATIGGSVVFVLFHRFLGAMACRVPAFRRLIKGDAEELVRNGKLIPATLRKHNIAKEDVLEDLRLDAKVEELAKIRVARLECNGDLSFIKDRG
jgi:uncharacterized membrane protein YcaP (DUF421 family)